jgi:drug/metabolite transporter (DMT)-like permease
MFRESLTPMMMVGVAVTVLGVALVVRPADNDPKEGST